MQWMECHPDPNAPLSDSQKLERREAEASEAAENKRARNEVPPEINDLTRRTIGAAIAVHRELGPGFLEHVYEEACVVELTRWGIQFERQLSVPVFYRDKLIAESRIDLVIEKRIVLELKAVEQLRPVHRSQVVSYLRAGGYQLGLLINFNVSQLRNGIERIVWTY